jgi:hypothetical protein
LDVRLDRLGDALPRLADVSVRSKVKYDLRIYGTHDTIKSSTVKEIRFMERNLLLHWYETNWVEGRHLASNDMYPSAVL